MKQPTDHRTDRLSRALFRSRILGAALLVASGLAACSDDSDGGGTTSPQTGLGTDPTTGNVFFVEKNQGGDATSLKIKALFWGRLVDVYDIEALTGDRRLQFQGFLVGQDIQSDGVDFLLERNPVTGQEQLTYLHELVTEDDYLILRNRLEQNLQPVIEKGLVGELPPFSAMPRNAAMAIVFDDLLNASTVNSSTVVVQTGNPPSVPFEALIFPDPVHGSLADHGQGEQFYSTRVIVKTTVSQLEAQQNPLPVNALGLPQAPITTQANVAIRFPTELDQIVGQTELLKNPSGHLVSFTSNGPVDNTSTTGDVVRAFRSGTSTDPANGFLPDNIDPRIIGVQDVTLSNVVPLSADSYVVDVTFGTPVCAIDAEPGDVLQTSTVFAEIVDVPDPLAGATLTNVEVQVLNNGPFLAGAASFLSPFDSVFDQPECFIRFSPPPRVAPKDEVAVNAEVIVRFSEPMDPASILPFDTFSLQPADTTGLTALEGRVVGSISPSADLIEYRFRPAVNLAHVQGTSESYLVQLSGLASDLAGRALQDPLGQTDFTIDPTDPTIDTGNIALTFESLDEDGNGNPEISGNFLYDFLGLAVLPRPVSRFSAILDSNQPMIAPMQVFGFPIQTPHSNLGSKMQTVWRHVDMGFGLLDPNTWDLDVEGLNWSPFGGSVQLDTFTNFEIRLAHSLHLPDEEINGMSLLPNFPLSGLKKSFDGNVLPGDSQTIVSPATRGYTIQPLESFFASTGTIMQPWPVNQNVLPQDQIWWTWRDTGIPALGAPSGVGADPGRFYQIQFGTGAPNPNTFPVDMVPTIGLPMLMEFRCFPDANAFGQTGLQIALAVNSSSRPFFRAFSTGGVDQGGFVQTVDPNNEPNAQGGYNPTLGGQPTAAQDNSMHFGQADFVVRVSRIHTIWFDSGALTGAVYADPVIEPEFQPTDTSVTLAFRGATLVSGSFANGNNVGAYGDPDNSALNGAGNYSVSFLNGDNNWKSSMSAIDGAQYFQARVTFISNPESGLSPRLSALGFAFDR